MNLLILGKSQHGKDTCADIITANTELTSLSSSKVATPYVRKYLERNYGLTYTTDEEAHYDRHQHQVPWFLGIRELNRIDPTFLAKHVLDLANIYVGMRSYTEFCGSRYLFDMIIYVNADERYKTVDPTMQIPYDATMEQLFNNGTEQEFDDTMKLFIADKLMG